MDTWLTKDSGIALKLLFFVYKHHYFSAPKSDIHVFYSLLGLFVLDFKVLYCYVLHMYYK